MNFGQKSITITYGDCAENHNGMQIIGKMADRGFTVEDLDNCKIVLENLGVRCKMINLNDYTDKKQNIDYDQARVLVVKKGVDHILKPNNKTSDDMFKELESLKWDTKAFMYGRVVNKKARYNICIADKAQKPDFEAGKGTIIPFRKLGCCNEIRKTISRYLDKAENLVGEGNCYYDDTCGIGWHGDSERRKVLAVKLGDVKPLYFQWYLKGQRIGDMCQIDLEHGDLYIMSEKAVGTDWKTRLIPTLRHSTGADTFTK